MRDHEYPMSDARERALDAIDPTPEMLRDEYGDDADLDDARIDHEQSAILSEEARVLATIEPHLDALRDAAR